ncbi:MAG: VanW family protein [Chloroflexi bacterium]|nr:VanW family protein [Chloroflexota bacterium]
MLVSLVVTPVAAVVYHHVAYQDRVYPGVFLNGRDIGGKTVAQVFTVAIEQGNYYEGQNLKIDVGGQVKKYSPTAFGSHIDPAAVVRHAFKIGRNGDWQNMLRERALVYWFGVDIGSTVYMDEAAAVARVRQIAAEFDQPVVDASLKKDDVSGKIQETQAQAGVTIDQAAAVQAIEAAIRTRQAAPIVLPTLMVAPRIPSASKAAIELAYILSEDLVVMLPVWNQKDQPQEPVEAFRISHEQLARYASVVEEKIPDGTVTLRVMVNDESIRALLQPFSSSITGTVENAHFTFDEASKNLKVVKPGRPGRAIDIDATLKVIEQNLRSPGPHKVTIAVKQIQPPFSDSVTAAELGITQLITQATTYFRGSSAARIANVKLAALRFHGVIVPPGEIFSFNQYLGNVSKEDGFEEGLIIVGNRTEKGVGGGVCQVSTTAFQAALRAGFPIIERYPHGYRVSYYENGMGAGYDAAVFTPVADMKFRNDTKTHLLIESYFDPAEVTLTFKFFGTSDGRVVMISQPSIMKVVPHAPDLYEPDPDNQLAPGEVKQVEHAVDGATITFTRKVTRGDSVLINEAFTSRYVPWRNVYRFGPDFVVPEGSELATPEPTPDPAAAPTPDLAVVPVP